MSTSTEPIGGESPLSARRSVSQVAWLSAGISIAAIWAAVLLAGRSRRT